MSRKEYRSEDINVAFDAGRCLHAKECVHGLPEVFDVEKRPWIQPANSDPDTVAEVVMRCPTGALHFTREDAGGEEPVPEENIVVVAGDGPLYLRGAVTLEEYDGTLIAEDTRVALCRCGESRNKPFCDNSHRNSGFRDDGMLAAVSSGEESPTGKLTVTVTVNGPLSLKGGFEIRDSEGTSSYRGDQAALCRCGYSGNKPFCDGTHGGIGWRDD
ncbi:MAG: CDGSH iron-sulfur domain-containing protein [Rubrobacteraceae bacterium]